MTDIPSIDDTRAMQRHTYTRDQLRSINDRQHLKRILEAKGRTSGFKGSLKDRINLILSDQEALKGVGVEMKDSSSIGAAIVSKNRKWDTVMRLLRENLTADTYRQRLQDVVDAGEITLEQFNEAALEILRKVPTWRIGGLTGSYTIRPISDDELEQTAGILNPEQRRDRYLDLFYAQYVRNDMTGMKDDDYELKSGPGTRRRQDTKLKIIAALRNNDNITKLRYALRLQANFEKDASVEDHPRLAAVELLYQTSKDIDVAALMDQKKWDPYVVQLFKARNDILAIADGGKPTQKTPSSSKGKEDEEEEEEEDEDAPPSLPPVEDVPTVELSDEKVAITRAIQAWSTQQTKPLYGLHVPTLRASGKAGEWIVEDGDNEWMPLTRDVLDGLGDEQRLSLIFTLILGLYRAQKTAPLVYGIADIQNVVYSTPDQYGPIKMGYDTFTLMKDSVYVGRFHVNPARVASYPPTANDLKAGMAADISGLGNIITWIIGNRSTLRQPPTQVDRRKRIQRLAQLMTAKNVDEVLRMGSSVMQNGLFNAVMDVTWIDPALGWYTPTPVNLSQTLEQTLGMLHGEILDQGAYHGAPLPISMDTGDDRVIEGMQKLSEVERTALVSLADEQRRAAQEQQQQQSAKERQKAEAERRKKEEAAEAERRKKDAAEAKARKAEETARLARERAERERAEAEAARKAALAEAAQSAKEGAESILNLSSASDEDIQQHRFSDEELAAITNVLRLKKIARVKGVSIAGLKTAVDLQEAIKKQRDEPLATAEKEAQEAEQAEAAAKVAEEEVDVARAELDVVDAQEEVAEAEEELEKSKTHIPIKDETNFKNTVPGTVLKKFPADFFPPGTTGVGKKQDFLLKEKKLPVVDVVEFFEGIPDNNVKAWARAVSKTALAAMKTRNAALDVIRAAQESAVATAAAHVEEELEELEEAEAAAKVAEEEVDVARAELDVVNAQEEVAEAEEELEESKTRMAILNKTGVTQMPAKDLSKLPADVFVQIERKDSGAARIRAFNKYKLPRLDDPAAFFTEHDVSDEFVRRWAQAITKDKYSSKETREDAIRKIRAAQKSAVATAAAHVEEEKEELEAAQSHLEEEEEELEEAKASKPSSASTDPADLKNYIFSAEELSLIRQNDLVPIIRAKGGKSIKIPPKKLARIALILELQGNKGAPSSEEPPKIKPKKKKSSQKSVIVADADMERLDECQETFGQNILSTAQWTEALNETSHNCEDAIYRILSNYTTEKERKNLSRTISATAAVFLTGKYKTQWFTMEKLRDKKKKVVSQVTSRLMVRRVWYFANLVRQIITHSEHVDVALALFDKLVAPAKSATEREKAFKTFAKGKATAEIGLNISEARDILEQIERSTYHDADMGGYDSKLIDEDIGDIFRKTLVSNLSTIKAQPAIKNALQHLGIPAHEVSSQTFTLAGNTANMDTPTATRYYHCLSVASDMLHHLEQGRDVPDMLLQRCVSEWPAHYFKQDVL